jgi:predicted nucleic acid-binding protein
VAVLNRVAPNVYVSALIRPDGPPGQIVTRFLREGSFEIVLSLAIVDETVRAFGYPKVRKAKGMLKACHKEA